MIQVRNQDFACAGGGEERSLRPYGSLFRSEFRDPPPRCGRFSQRYSHLSSGTVVISDLVLCPSFPYPSLVPYKTSPPLSRPLSIRSPSSLHNDARSQAHLRRPTPLSGRCLLRCPRGRFMSSPPPLPYLHPPSSRPTLSQCDATTKIIVATTKTIVATTKTTKRLSWARQLIAR